MPANVTPEYERAEKRFRQATTDEEKLQALREMLSTIPKHKGTEKMQADIKRRISRLRKAEAKKGRSKGPDPFHIPKTGAGQVVLIGPPNSGKSMLVETTTNAPVKVAEYPFATPLPVPGMWTYEDVQIELVDTPPVATDHIPAGLMGTIRGADLLAVVVDAADKPLEQAEMVLALLADRGLLLRSVPLGDLGPAEASGKGGLIIANKIDLAPAENIASLAESYTARLDVASVSALTGEGLAGLQSRLWGLLSMIRVYTKQPGRPPDKKKPFTLPAGATVENLASEIHRELSGKMKFARIWRDGRFNGQQVHRTETLHDKDIVEIHE